jgi:hypothetical protein
MVNIQKILLKYGLFSQDIRIRMKNGQIKLDGEPITDSHMELNIEFDEEDKNFKFLDLSDFLFGILVKGGLGRELLLGTWAAGVDLDSLSQTNLQNHLVDVFKKIHIVRISAWKAIVLIKK